MSEINDHDNTELLSDSPGRRVPPPPPTSRQHKHKSVCKTDVKNNLPLLKLLCKADDEERRNVLKRIDVDGLGVICCCIHNALFNTKAVVPRQHWKPIQDGLKDKRKAFHYISKFDNNPAKKRKLLVQNGGSLPLLLSSLLPQISAAVNLDRQKRRKTGTLP